MNNFIKIYCGQFSSLDPKINVIVECWESVSIFTRPCLRRRSGIFTHYLEWQLWTLWTRRFAKHIFFEQSLVCMTHRETICSRVQNRPPCEWCEFDWKFRIANLARHKCRIIPIEIRTRILLGLRLFLEVGSYSDLPPHEWRRRRQTRARSTNGASFAANMLGLCASRQLTHKNAKLPFLPRVEQCATREKWFSRLLWLFSHPNELIFQLDYPIVQAMFTFWYAISLKDVFLLIDFLMKRNMFKAKTTTKRLLWSDMEFVTSCTSTFV